MRVGVAQREVVSILDNRPQQGHESVFSIQLHHILEPGTAAIVASSPAPAQFSLLD
jgi:hypothetical protein